jgi:3'(2'), 5'-bisphosphate nucleotidase
MAEQDDELARELAQEAGQRLLMLRGSWTGDDQKALGKAGDRLSQEYLAEQLAKRRPDDAVLSEEALDDPARLTADRVWIVDPLDGTREYGEGRSDWAVHVALWERGDLVAGAVALPGQEVTLSTAGELPEAPASVASPARIVVSRSRPPAFITAVADKIGADLVPLGSAGAKVSAVVLGEADAYVHGGGFYEWDTAAPAVVARAAGFHVSRIDGSPVAYNQANPLMPDILVCPPVLAGEILEAIREVAHAD